MIGVVSQPRFIRPPRSTGGEVDQAGPPGRRPVITRLGGVGTGAPAAIRAPLLGGIVTRIRNTLLNYGLIWRFPLINNPHILDLPSATFKHDEAY